MTKQQWLDQTVMCDEWGRPPSLADVPLTYLPRKKAFDKRKYSKEQVDKLYKEYQKNR